MPVEFVILDESNEPISWVSTEKEVRTIVNEHLKGSIRGIKCKKIIKSDAGHIAVEGKEYEVALSREEPYNLQ